MRRVLFMVITVLGALVVPRQVVPAHADTTPGAFALTYLDFPPPAKIVASRVESNAMAANEPGVVHFGSSFDVENRLDGYYMESGTLNLDNKGSTHVVATAYLVSHFATSDLASAAFAEQHNGWEGEIVTPESGS